LIAAVFICGMKIQVQRLAKGNLLHGRRAGDVRQSQALLPTLRAAYRNNPFIQLLVMEVCAKSVAVVHYSNIFLYFKYGQRRENPIAFQEAYFLCVSVSAIMWSRFVGLLTRNHRAQHVFAIAAAHGAAALLLCATFRAGYFLFALPIFLGMTEACTQVLVPKMFSNVVQYDELRTGVARGSVFISLKGMVEQEFLIVMALYPGLILSLSGYLPNSGCTCGCGSACEHAYLSWDCPGDIGYSCGSAYSGQQQLLGPFRVPACMSGQPVFAMLALKAITFGLPVRTCVQHQS